MKVNERDKIFRVSFRHERELDQRRFPLFFDEHSCPDSSYIERVEIVNRAA